MAGGAPIPHPYKTPEWKREVQRRYYWKHQDKVRKKMREEHQKHRDARRAAQKAYWEQRMASMTPAEREAEQKRQAANSARTYKRRIMKKGPCLISFRVFETIVDGVTVGEARKVDGEWVVDVRLANGEVLEDILIEDANITPMKAFTGRPKGVKETKPRQPKRKAA